MVPAGDQLTPQSIHDIVVRVMADAKVSASTLRVVEVGVPGVVDPGGELSDSFVLPDWANQPIRQQLEGLLGAPTVLENDANLAALTEHALGAGQGAENMVYLMVGNRVSSGVIIQGRLHRGSHGAAGEIGSLPQESWPRPHEHLMEQVDSITSQLPPRGAGSDSAGEVFRLAASGDPTATGVRDAFVKDVANYLIAVTLVVDPDVVVVGGGGALAGEPFLGALRSELARTGLRQPELRRARHVADAVVLGAVQGALRYLDDRVFGLSVAV